MLIAGLQFSKIAVSYWLLRWPSDPQQYSNQLDGQGKTLNVSSLDQGRFVHPSLLGGHLESPSATARTTPFYVEKTPLSKK